MRRCFRQQRTQFDARAIAPAFAFRRGGILATFRPSRPPTSHVGVLRRDGGQPAGTTGRECPVNP